MVIITSFRHPESSVKLLQRNVRAFLDKKDLGAGTLFVSESNLCWQERDDIGLCIDYHSISLHAVSKDVNLHPEECIYVLIDSHINMAGEEPQHQNEEDDSDAESEADVSELILIPESSETLQSIYEAIRLCQELNPDPEDMDNEDDFVYEDAEDDMEEVEEENDFRAGGDTGEVNVIEDLARRMESNGVNHNNGHGEEEDQFEDAD